MVFVGDVWQTSLPVKPMLDGIFTSSKAAQAYKSWVKLTSDASEAVDLILSFPGKPSGLLAQRRPP